MLKTNPPTKMKKPSEESEILALEMLSYIIDRETPLIRFLELSGIDHERLGELLPRPETLAAIMDFMLQNEDLLAPFCQEHHLSPEQLWRLRRQLSVDKEQ